MKADLLNEAKKAKTEAEFDRAGLHKNEQQPNESNNDMAKKDRESKTFLALSQPKSCPLQHTCTRPVTLMSPVILSFGTFQIFPQHFMSSSFITLDPSRRRIGWKTTLNPPLTLQLPFESSGEIPYFLSSFAG